MTAQDTTPTTASTTESGTQTEESRGSELTLDQISKTFGEFHAVQPLDLTVPAGEFFALLGPSGCGKTTTLRMVAGLEKPSGGSIRIGGTDVTSLPPFKRPVNTVFQSYALFPHMSVRENVAFGLRRRKVKEWKAQADEFLELVELTHLADRKPGQLSGGQQQRVALARALVNQPEILLLDEPLGALDMKLRRQMQSELKRIQTDVGLTFIHVTHDQEEAMTMADTVAVMNAGRIEQMGAPEDLYDLPQTAFVANFLGRSNLMAGSVTGGSGADGMLEIDASGHRLLLDSSRAVSTTGDVLVGVRPEKIALRPAGTRAGGEPVVVGTSGVVNEVDGTVTDVSFTGVSTEYRVDVPGLGELGVFAQNRDATRIRPGDAVELSWDPSRAFGLDGAEDAAAGEDAA
ncbi:ABC transporter ATP-binding protein [Micrococcus sp. IITD107]|uniref:ABC transporter ATP-binding protein n=1 Tax=Micrococcus sp. IITD107 TaxID=3342790 RepID=UPI0035B6B1E9